MSRGLRIFLSGVLFFGGVSPAKARISCDEVLRPPSTMREFIQQMDTLYPELRLTEKMEDKFSPQQRWLRRLATRKRRALLNADLSTFRYSDRADRFMLSIYQNLNPRGWRRLLVTRDSLQADMSDVVAVNLLREGFGQLLEAGELLPTQTPRWRKALGVSLKLLLDPPRLIPSYLGIPLEPALARKVLIDGLDRLSPAEQKKVAASVLTTHTAQSAKFLIRIGVAALMLIVTWDAMEEQELERKEMLEDGKADLRRAKQEFAQITPEAVQQTVVDIQFAFILQRFRETYRREPTDAEKQEIRKLLKREI